jgi:hypothetical protein
MEKVTVVSDEMREVAESEWPELAHKLPPGANSLRVQSRKQGHPHLMAELLSQFSGVLHFLSRAVASINLSSS